MDHRHLYRLLLLVSLFFIWTPAAFSQTAQVTGRVSDPSGAVVPGTNLTVTNLGTGLKRETVTNDEGYYTIPLLPPGGYQITVQKDGFKPISQSGITLQVEQVARLDFKLELGSPSETVQVTGGTPLLESETSSVGQVVDNKKIVDLPLNQRNPFSLALLVPGVVGSIGRGFTGAQLTINGGRMATNEILLDGIPSAPPIDGQNPFTVVPSVDAVQEFRVQTSNYSAEFGLSGGGIINLIYKSGANELHGSLYEFLRNSVFDANNFFANRSGVPRASFKRNQFGGSVGGPVVLPKKLFGPFGYDGHNKTFFFASYEGLRERVGANLLATVPTAAMRGGDFSQLRNAAGQQIMIFDPTTTMPSGSGFVRQQFPGNVIPADRLDPVARNILRHYPLPNRPGDPNTGLNNFAGSGTLPFDINQWDVKIDQHLSDRQRFAARFSRRTVANTFHPVFFRGGDLGSADGSLAATEVAHNVAFDYLLTVSPTYLVNFRYGFARNLFDILTPSTGFDPTTLGFPAYFRNNLDVLVFPRIAPQGYLTVGTGDALGIGGAAFEGHTWNLANTKSLSRHVLKFGGEMRLFRNNNRQAGNNGNFNFSRSLTQGPNPQVATGGDGFASFLLGLGGGTVTKNLKFVSTQSFYYGFYLNDDWKATSKLTFNLGLRYDLSTPRTERFNRHNYIDLQAPHPLGAQIKDKPGFSECPACASLKGGLVFASEKDRTLYETDSNNIAPRFGFAYQATKRTVVRGAYGLFYSTSAQAAAGTIGINGYRSNSPLLGSLDGLTPNHYLRDPFPNGYVPVTGNSLGLMTFVGLGPAATLRNTVTPYTQNWNFGIQHELPGSVLVDASYVGSRGVHLSDTFIDVDQLDPKHLALGAKLLEQVPNPFFGLITTGTLSRPTVQRRFLLRPYPQFDGLFPIYVTGASSIYHSFQLKVEKRLSAGLSLLLAYTKGKLIDDASQTTGNYGREGVRQNAYDRRGDRSISPNDISQRLVISYVYELPLGRGRAFGRDWNRATDALLGGWQINGITSFQTGLPLTLNAPNTCNCFNQGLRPNISGSAKLSGDVHDRLDAYFNTAVFSQPALYSFGNATRTLPDVRSPGTHNWDFSLFKNFRATERLNVQFRAEAFNALNRVQFGFPDQSFGNLGRGFGQIRSQANAPRQVQFGLKILF
ncbi:MAG: TonB-dependent receptor domain-containing protein [Acidobacteriota bacterium]